jgi:hypothetical protein
MFVASGIIELELRFQKSQENGNTTAYNGVQQNESSVQLSVGDSHGKLEAEEQLEVNL